MLNLTHYRFGGTSLLLATTVVTLLAADDPIDWNKARELHQRTSRGEKLTPEEQAYYDRARAARQKEQSAQRPAAPAPWTQHLTPLTELGTNTYKGESGGLYGRGQNDAPAAHAEMARRLAAKIRPLDAEGQPAASGKIVLISLGMSNTTMEFSRFRTEVERDPAKSPALVIVDGAQGGQTASAWAKPEARAWTELENRLARASVTARQVQVVWIKEAEAQPARLGDFPAHAQFLKTQLITVLHLLKQKYPNLQLAYLSSRIYAGYAVTPLNPEPYAYESAFSVRWLIQDQMSGKSELNCDSAKGEVKAPVLLWGPYLWADGTTPRKGDGLTWAKEDFEGDGTHPSISGRAKVAQLLLKFFKTESTAGWFVEPLNR